MLSEDEGRRSGNPPEVEALRVALVRLKEEKDLSLTVLARDSHISRSTWNRVLKGESFPPRKEIERLSRKPRFEAQHLVGLWEAADAAIKQADAAAGSQPPVTPDGDIAVSPPAEAGAVPAPADSSTAAAAAVSSGDAPEPAGLPLPDTTTVAKTDETAVPSVPADHEGDISAEPAAAASPSPTPDTRASAGQPLAGGERNAAQPAPAPDAAEIGLVRPVPVPAPATKTGRTAKLLIALLALTVVLLIGRWAAMPDASKDDTATPGATGETLPSDAGNADEGTEGGDTGNRESPQDTAQPSGGPTTAGSDDKPQDLPAAGPGASGAQPEASSGTENTAPPAGQTPRDDAPSSALTTAPQTATTTPTAPRTTAPATAPTTDTSPGAEGRTSCAHYKPNRRVILARGMVGTNVAQVQCLLNHNYDYNLTEDGKFGAGTETAVKAVQRCSGIPADGQVGPTTWKYLDYPKPACGH
ncbi:peptidoglycan-binding protein [Streptomyces zaomyceticus]|uniref:peptidoglycan-binding protein n=1 Tax=Streptomyces zaomyceticus TaxID=68286 RepID=UPI002E1D7268